MLALALLAACALPAALAAVECPAGTYFHTHGSVDCAPGAACAGTVESCCCACHANYYCPGGKTRQPEDPCPAGSTSPPNSTSAAACTGGPPPPPSGAFSQIHVAYTGRAEELSVDFVGGAGQTFVWTSLARAAGWTRAPATSFAHPTIGYMSAGLLRFAGVQPDAPAYYMVGDASANSSVYEVTPTIAARPEVFAVYADFGFANDVCMADLVSEAAKGGFDSVLHAGDWAYNMEDSNSLVGNNFMEAIQPFASVKPVMPAEGNHERCSKCSSAIPGVPAGNFTEYTARMWSVGSVGAGAASGSYSPRYYSFNRGLTHFLFFSAEAYTYSSGATFIANQLAFMKRDLAAVDRAVTPWVVAVLHKAFWMETQAYADFNPVLNDGKVDLLFCGHYHYYSRYKPYNNLTNAVDDASISADGATYTDPKYMVTIITGASGDKESDSPYDKPFPSYTGTDNYGYGLYTAVSPTKATWTFKTVQADTGAPDYADSLTIIKTAAA